MSTLPPRKRPDRAVCKTLVRILGSNSVNHAGLTSAACPAGE